MSTLPQNLTNGNTQNLLIAKIAIGSVLDGNAPNGADPAEMGAYATPYAEMARAWQDGGTDAARRVFNACAVQMPDLIRLIAGSAEREARRTEYSAAELMAAQFPDISWVVPGLIPTGLAFLAGRPKLGKSWLALQIAVAVGTGGMVLGRRVDAGSVLYLALEDSPLRIQDRLRKQGATVSTDIDFRFTWQPLTAGGAGDLVTALARRPYKLIIVDTISRALGRADQMDAVDMNTSMALLQRITLDHNTTMLLVDHHRKTNGINADLIDDLMGATAKAAVADVGMGLYRERGKTEAVLRVTGRDVEDSETAMTFDSLTGCWQIMGDASGVRTESVQSNILTAISELGGKATVKQVADWLRRDKANIFHEVKELVAKGKLARMEKSGRQVLYKIAEESQLSQPSQPSQPSQLSQLSLATHTANRQHTSTPI